MDPTLLTPSGRKPLEGSVHLDWADRRRLRQEDRRQNRHDRRIDQRSIDVLPFCEFTRDYKPPAYLIDGIILRHRLYSLTGKTGHGKTAIGLTVACEVAQRGERAVYLAAENPDDIKMRAVLMKDRSGLPENLPLHFVGGGFELSTEIDALEVKVGAIGGASLVVVDTGAAFLAHSGTEDENSNLALLRFALTLRELTELPGHPAVVVLMHPTKGAIQETLLPRGGGAFLNEVDGNLCVWAEGDRSVAELSWCGKFRGPSFDPVRFALEVGECDALVDAEGQKIPSVWARQIGEEETERLSDRQRTDATALLDQMAMVPEATVRQRAEYLSWQSEAGAPNTARVHRAMKRLQEAGLAAKDALTDRWKLTAAGRDRAKDR